MAKAIDIACPSNFPTHGDPTSLGVKWRKWRQGFNLYLTAAGITDPNQKKALLLHCGGTDLQEIHSTLTEPAVTDTTTVYDVACTALDNHFLPKQNKRYERHIFRSNSQMQDESISQYVTRLRTLAKSCEFPDVDDELVDQVIEKCYSKKLRKRLLKERDLTLDKLLEISLIIESADRQAIHYEDSAQHHHHHIQSQLCHDSDEDEINKLSHISYKKKLTLPKSSIALPPAHAHTKSSQQCYRCGSKTHLANKCDITKGKTCHNCGKSGHFKNVCQSKSQALPTSTIQNQTIHYITAPDSSSDDEFCFTIVSSQTTSNTQTVTIQDTNLPVLIDSGSTVNVISTTTLHQIHPTAKVFPTTKIFMLLIVLYP